MTKLLMKMNEDRTRAVMTDSLGFDYLTGELNNVFVSSFTPPLVKYNVWQIMKAWFQGVTLTPYNESEIVSIPVSDYIWVRFKDKSKPQQVIKVITEDCVNKNRFRYNNPSIIYHSGKVMIKGVGIFVWSDFVEVKF